MDENRIYFSDVERGILVVDRNGQYEQIAGKTGMERKDGFGKYAMLAQPTGLAVEGATVFITDTAIGSVRILTKISPILTFLQNSRDLLRTFGIHSDITGDVQVPVGESVKLLQSIGRKYEEISADAARLQQLGPIH